MTIEQKISILIRKYGSKAVIQDNNSSLNGISSSFSANKVVPSQLWIDLKDVPQGKNPLLNSAVNLSTWPAESANPVIVKIIKKELTWIPGTNAFHDPGLDSDPSTVLDVISPDVDISYSPFIYALNTISNRYLEPLSPNKYSWVFDYETGCLVFVDGIPSFIKSPQFQPPAVTCYRYLGRKTAEGIGTNMVSGSTGPTGPTGATGPTRLDAMVWRGIYDQSLSYSVDDTVYKEGIIWVKTTGPTGPSDVTSAYFDSITYNELVDGFVQSNNEQYIDVEYTTNTAPYFESLDELSTLLSSNTGANSELKGIDQNINIFDVSGPQNFYSRSLPQFSNRLFFFSPERISSEMDFYLDGAGYRLFSFDGMHAANFNIFTQSSLNIERSRLVGSGTTAPYGVIDYLPNSTVVTDRVADLSASFSQTLFEDMQVNAFGSIKADSCDFMGCTLNLGDAGLNSPPQKFVYPGVIQYFKDCRFIDTKFIAQYTGEYEEITLIFERCRITESRQNILDAGFTFPDRPARFDLNDPNSIRINIVFIDTLVTCKDSIFNFFGGINFILSGTNTLPERVFIVNTDFFPSGVQVNDPNLSAFLATQNSYSQMNPRTTTNFYFNQ